MEFKQDIDNECAFYIEKRDGFCAPEEVVEKIKENILGSAMVGDEQAKEEIKKELGCDTEVCILQHPKVEAFIGQPTYQLIRERFKPVGPRGTQWLSNVDIDSVLDQIQKKYTDKHFLHIEFQMIDFEETGGELAKLEWPAKFAIGYRTFGCVLNTDTSRGMGKHWFAIFGDFTGNSDSYTIEYFNSSGELPPHQIAMWMKRVKHRWQSHFDKPILDVVATRIVNQYDGHSCGSYSLYYIISRLDGVPYQYFAQNAIGDHNMHEFRKYLFREE